MERGEVHSGSRPQASKHLPRIYHASTHASTLLSPQALQVKRYGDRVKDEWGKGDRKEAQLSSSSSSSSPVPLPCPASPTHTSIHTCTK